MSDDDTNGYKIYKKVSDIEQKQSVTVEAENQEEVKELFDYAWEGDE